MSYSKKKNYLLIMFVLVWIFGFEKAFAYYYNGGEQVSSYSGTSNNSNSVSISSNNSNESGNNSNDSNNENSTNSTEKTEEILLSSEDIKASAKIALDELNKAMLDETNSKLYMDKAQEAYDGAMACCNELKTTANELREMAKNENTAQAYILLQMADQKEREAQNMLNQVSKAMEDYRRHEGDYHNNQVITQSAKEKYYETVKDATLGDKYEEEFAKANEKFTADYNVYSSEYEKMSEYNELSPLEKQTNYSTYLKNTRTYSDSIKNIENSLAGLRDSSSKLGDYYKECGYVGDPVLIGTGDFSLNYEDYKAVDYVNYFNVTRDYFGENVIDSFGRGWTCSLDSRIARCVFEDFSERIDILKECFETAKKMESAFDEYNEQFPEFPREEIGPLVQKAKDERESYEKELADVTKLMEVRKSLLAKNKYCMYGRFKTMESVYGFEDQLIFMDETGHRYYFQYIAAGHWVPFADVIKGKIEIFNLNSNKEYSHSEDCSGGYVVHYSDGTNMYYNEYGILTRKANRNNIGIDFKNQNGLINEIILATGETIQVKRNKDNYITSISGKTSGKATYLYSNELLISVVDNKKVKTEYGYKNNKLFRIKKGQSIIQLDWVFNNHLEKYVCSRVTAENGSYETFDYDLSNRKVVHTTNAGKKEYYTLNEFGYPINIIDRYGNRTSFTTNNLGLITSASFPEGKKKLFSYDEFFRPVKIQSEIGGIVTINYSPRQKGMQTESITDEDGFTRSYEYDSSGNIIQEFLNNELITSISYYPNGLIKTFTDDEQTNFYEYNNYGSVTLQQIKKNSGQIYEQKMFYDEFNKLIKIQDAQGDITTFSYKEGMQTEVNQRLKKNSYFDERNRLCKEEYFDLINGSKKTKEYVYENGNVAQVLIDGLLYEEFEYSNDDELISYTKYSLGGRVASEGVQEKYVFDKNYVSEYIKQRKNQKDNDFYSIEDKSYSRKYEYSSFNGNKVVKFTNEMGIESTATYNAYGNIINETFPNGYNIKTVYSKAGRILQKVDSEQKVWDYVYKNNGSYDVVLSTPRGIICKSEYDRKGRLIRSKDIINGNSYFEYEGDFCVLERTSDYVRKTEFDSYGRKTLDSCKSLKDGKTFEDYKIVYNDVEKTVSLFAGKSDLSFYECKYDGFGRIIQVLDKNGKAEFEYDSLDRVISKSDGYGRKTIFEYDANNQMNYILFSDLTERFINHDVNGNITSVVQNGKVLSNTIYDVENKKTSFVDIYGTQFDFFYGKDGIITKEVISKSGEYDFSRKNGSEQLNELSSLANGLKNGIYNMDGSFKFVERNILGKPVRLRNENSDFVYEYDLLQNLISVEDGLNGSKIKYEYDNFGRCVHQIVNDCENYFTYDLCGNVNAILDGQKNILVSFEYDELNREIAKKYLNGVQEYISYNGNCLVETKIVKDKIGQLLYCDLLLYDNKNRLKYKFDENGNFTHYTYKKNGQLNSIEYPLDNELWEYNLQESFDCGYPIEENAKSSLFYLDFETFSEVYQLLNKTGLNSLVRIVDCQNVWKEEYEYTKNGSVSSVNNPLGKIIFTYDDNNRVQEKFYEHFPDNKMTFLWDNNGNLVELNGVNSKLELSYNENNRISKADYLNRSQNTRQIVNYEYDGLNRRILEYDNSNAVAYMYDGFSTNIIEKYSVFRSGQRNNYVSSTVLNESVNKYRYTDDSLYSAFGSEKSQNQILSGINNVSAIENTNSVNINIDGEILSVGKGNSINLRLTDYQNRVELEIGNNATKFSHVDDYETNYTRGYNLLAQMQDFGYRDYIPSIKSFTSEDPIRDGINWYSYCSGDCVNYFDKSGYYIESITSFQCMNEPWQRNTLLGNSKTETIYNAGCYIVSIANIVYTLNEKGILPSDKVVYTRDTGINSNKSLFSEGNLIRSEVINQVLSFETDTHKVTGQYIDVNKNGYLTQQQLCLFKASPNETYVNTVFDLSDSFEKAGNSHMLGVNSLCDQNGVFSDITISSHNDTYRIETTPSAYGASNVVTLLVVTVENKNCAI